MSAATVAILGVGRVGQSMAILLRHANLRVWGRRPVSPFAAQVQMCNTIAEACETAAAVVFTVPLIALREVAREYGDVAQPDQVVLLTARGVETGFVLPHTILRQETCARQIGVLGGPLYALGGQVLRHGQQRQALVLASRFAQPCVLLQELVRDVPALVYPSRDVIGMQIASAIGNVTSMAVGMADVLHLGDTMRGVLLTRGLGEAARVAQALGGEGQTFASLAGVGALIPHPTPHADRHVELGELLAQGQPLSVALDGLDGEVDGVVTAREAVQLAAQRHINVPLMCAVDDICAGRVGAADALGQVLDLGLDFGDLRVQGAIA